MVTTLILYLFESILCLGVFMLAYRLFFTDSTHFHYRRFYLISSLLISIILPLMPLLSYELPAWLLPTAVSDAGQSLRQQTFSWMLLSPDTLDPAATSDATLPVFVLILMGLYLMGALFFAGILGHRLCSVYRLIRSGQCQKQAGYCLVRLEKDLPPFSFLHYLFLGPNSRLLSAAELELVKAHELAHIRQKHSLDLLCLEVVRVLFWFHPLLGYLKKKLREVHEYLADESVTREGIAKKGYAHLLLRLASEQNTHALSTAFSGKQISRRIIMLTRRRSKDRRKYGFAMLLPLSVLLLSLFACMEEPAQNFGSQTEAVAAGEDDSVIQSDQTIGEINWEGNTIYTDDELTAVLGLKKGDPFDKDDLQRRLSSLSIGKDIVSLYMDQGYLFFSIEPQLVEQSANVVDIRMQIFEGEQVRLGKIVFRGNETLSDEAILEKTGMQSGALFNRSQLIEAQRIIAGLGKFDPENVGINPLPRPEEQLVDIEFILDETDR